MSYAPGPVPMMNLAPYDTNAGSLANRWLGLAQIFALVLAFIEKIRRVLCLGRAARRPMTELAEIDRAR